MGLMSELTNNIRNDEKNYGYNKDQFMFHTGFKLFDFMNGQAVYNSKKKAEEYLTGIDAGKSIMIVGPTGSGKTTLGLQLAASIMQKYDESTLFIFDFEQSHTKARIQAVTGFSDEYLDSHVEIKKVGIYTDTVLKLVNQIASFKKQHVKELLTPNKEGVLNESGEPVKIMPPTFVFIDSIASMRPREANEGDELSSLTFGGRNAIANKDLFNRLLQPCMEANIIVIAINHITQNMSMGVTPPKASTRYLKNTEAVGGGSGIQYLCNLWLKVEPGNKLEEKDKYGIKGFVGQITVVKSRNSEGGRSIDMIFNQREGFDEDLSEFEFLNANKAIKGAGVGMYLENLPTTKFRMSTIKEKLATDQEFSKEFHRLTNELLKDSISISSRVQFQTEANAEARASGEVMDVAKINAEAGKAEAADNGVVPFPANAVPENSANLNE